MGILDLRIDLPNFRPVPGITQKNLGNTPEGIATLDHVAVGRIVGQRDALGGYLRGLTTGGSALDRRLHGRFLIAHRRAFRSVLDYRRRGIGPRCLFHDMGGRGSVGGDARQPKRLVARGLLLPVQPALLRQGRPMPLAP